MVTAVALSVVIVRPAIGLIDANPGIFRQIAPEQSGIQWSHVNARSDRRYLPETIPPGVAIFDYNNDGWMDLLFLNAGESTFFHPAKPPRPALYRNNHDGTFTDVTSEAGLKVNLFAMGAAAADYDGDGFEDLLITGYGRCILFHNNGDGTFTDVTARSGINPPGWSTSAVWFDYNNDGKLDLFVAQFVDYTSLKSCGGANAYGGSVEGALETQIYYCIPRVFEPMPSHLYRNDGNGHFTDVSGETGILRVPGKGFGVVATDIDNDGYLDLFQANDTVPNFLFVNRGGKTFEEIGLASGVGYSEDGLARSGMGVDAGDFDGDGRQDLFVANVDQEIFSLYRNNGDETFTDVSKAQGLARPTRLLSGWGLRFFDYDNDGWPDLILANGHPDDLVDKRMKGVTYAEPLLLFHNDGRGRLLNVSNSAGEAFQSKYAARGLAVGDLDNDGFPDVVVGVNGGAPLLLHNNANPRNHWVGLRLVGRQSNPEAVGALIRWNAGGVTHSRLKTAGGSYLSGHDNREILGMGNAAAIDWVEIRWPKPSERIDRFTNLHPDAYFTVVEGKGIQ
jgi:hypothetical protein